MTANQINYWNLQETKRHNLGSEAETSRANKAKEAIDLSKANETARANRANEAETNRSNLAKETETRRHNIQDEGFKMMDLRETNRHNVNTEKTNSYNAQTSRELADETRRSNLAREKETNRSNLVNEAERYRSNRANEEIGSRNADANQKQAEARQAQAEAAKSQAETARYVADLNARTNAVRNAIESRLADVQAGRLALDSANSQIQNEVLQLKSFFDNQLTNERTGLTSQQKQKIAYEIDNLIADTENKSAMKDTQYANTIFKGVGLLSDLLANFL